jgi:hypothetical protein
MRPESLWERMDQSTMSPAWRNAFAAAPSISACLVAALIRLT